MGRRRACHFQVDDYGDFEEDDEEVQPNQASPKRTPNRRRSRAAAAPPSRTDSSDDDFESELKEPSGLQPAAPTPPKISRARRRPKKRPKKAIGTAGGLAALAEAAEAAETAEAAEAEQAEEAEEAEEAGKAAGYIDRGWKMVKDGDAVPEAEQDSFVTEYSKLHAPGKPYIKYGSIDRPVAHGYVETLYRCGHKGCPALLRRLKRNGFCKFYKATHSTLLHNDHMQDVNGRGVPAYVLQHLSPSKLKMAPSKLRTHLRKEVNITITDKLKKALVNLHENTLKKSTQDRMKNSSGRGLYGGLFAICETLRKEVLIEKGIFNEDTAYIVGEPEISSETGRVTFVISTDNLLLNAYRQSQFGLPQYVQIDTTHRVISEGHCLLPITTTTVLQKCKVISYGICSSEDVQAHQCCIKNTRMGVNAIVHERAEKKERC